MRHGKNLLRTVVRVSGSVRQLMKPRVAVIVMVVLCLSGCGTHRETQMTNQHLVQSNEMSDSMFVLTEKSQSAVIVPQSKVHLELPVDSIKQLPSGANFSSRNGQASVRVSSKKGNVGAPDTIVVDATCDSLMLQCALYEQRIVRLNNKIQNQQEYLNLMEEDVKQHDAKAPVYLLIGFFLGFLLAIIVVIIIKVKF